jgi:hypothetical protein
VSEPQAERTAVLIIRLWVEGEPTVGFRARITRTLDVSKTEQVTTVSASKEEIREIFDRWFESFLATSGVSTRPV